MLCVCLLQVSIPELEAGLAAYYILAMSEASSNLSRYDGIRYGRRTQVRASGAACLTFQSAIVQLEPAQAPTLLPSSGVQNPIQLAEAGCNMTAPPYLLPYW